MKAQERDELLVELKTAMLGVRNTEDNGMVGDIKEIKAHLTIINGDVNRNTIWRKIHTKTISSIITVIVGIIITKARGLW